MCNFVSAIAHQVGMSSELVIIPGFDSHSDLLEMAGITDDEENTVRLEYIPRPEAIRAFKDGGVHDFSQWEFRVDQDRQPDWFKDTRDHWRDRMRRAIQRRSIACQRGDRVKVAAGSYLFSGPGEIEKLVAGGLIQFAVGTRIKWTLEGATIGHLTAGGRITQHEGMLFSTARGSAAEVERCRGHITDHGGDCDYLEGMGTIHTVSASGTVHDMADCSTVNRSCGTIGRMSGCSQLMHLAASGIVHQMVDSSRVVRIFPGGAAPRPAVIID